MADSARIAIKGDNSDLSATLDDSVSMFNSFGSKIKIALFAVGAAVAAKKVWDFGAMIVGEAMEAEKGVAQLDLVIKNLGSKAQLSRDDVLEFGDAIRDMSGFSGDAAVEAQTLFMRLDALDGKNIKRATVAAADLATVMKSDLPTAAAKITAALKDPERALGQFKSAGIEFTGAQEDMIKSLVKSGDEAAAIEIILGTLEQKIGGAAEAAGGTAAGQFTILQERLGDVYESIGTALLPVLESLLPAFDGIVAFIEDSVVPSIISVIGQFQEWGSIIADYIGPMFSWLVDAGVAAYTGLQTVVQNFADSMELYATVYVLAWVKAFEEVKHFLVEAMPAYLSWFGRNWMNIFKDIGNSTVTIFKNLWANITDFWDGLMSLLSGGDFKFEMTPLLKGFEAVTEELPKIAERVKGATEIALEGNATDLANKLKGAFDKNLKANRDALGLDSKGESAPERKMKENAAVAISKPSANAAALAEAEAKGKASVEADEKAKEDKKKEKDGGGAEASFEDLASLGKRIQAAAAGSKEKDTTTAVKEAGEKQASATAEVANELKQTNQILREQSGEIKKQTDEIKNGGGLG